MRKAPSLPKEFHEKPSPVENPILVTVGDKKVAKHLYRDGSNAVFEGSKITQVFPTGIVRIWDDNKYGNYLFIEKHPDGKQISWEKDINSNDNLMIL